MPSVGNTTWNNSSLNLIDLVEIVKEVVVAEGDSPVTIVGYSTGSVTALAFGGIYPDKVKTLITIAPWLANARQRYFFNFWKN